VIIVKPSEEIAIMERCDKILAAILDKLKEGVNLGIKTCALGAIYSVKGKCG